MINRKLLDKAETYAKVKFHFHRKLISADVRRNVLTFSGLEAFSFLALAFSLLAFVFSSSPLFSVGIEG